MSCYFRHIKDILEEAKIVVTPENKKQVDKAIHNIIGTTYKDCPTTWKKIKNNFLNDQQKRKELIRNLQTAID